jgi:predicted CoA-binding protein
MLASVSQVPQAIDIVDIFRPSDDVYPVVVDTIKKKGVKVIWMQEGIYNEGAEKLARENGLQVVYNRCMMAEHLRLFKR